MSYKGFSVRIPAFVAGILLSLFLGACSTQKNSFINRSYHRVNAKYNGYFNARENYRDGLNRLADAHMDNFEEVLSVFRYGTPQQAASITPQMDVAYEKASLVIRRHSMNIRGVEYNPWIDHSFFLIARTHFFKRDFNLAILTLEHIIRTYDSDIRYQAKLWLAKTYIEQERWQQAAEVLERSQRNLNDALLDRQASLLYHKVSADYYIRRENFQPAIMHVEQAAGLSRNKDEKARLSFIQAQLYQQTGQFASAQRAYNRVIRMRPDFDMAFQARIRMAMAYDPSAGGAGNIREELMRMLRDSRNQAYRDQIYYALAELSKRQSDERQAIEYYLKSTEVSEGNNAQKSLSFLRLGEIYFSRPEYLQASIYYDSTMRYLPPQHENYNAISQRRQLLGSLARNIRIIEREDSLQRLASMSEAEQRAVVDRIIADVRLKEQQEREAERERMRTMQVMAQTRLQGSMGPQDGGWYFYNPSAISFGRTEFISRFGERPLQDNWRIGNLQGGDDLFAFDDDWDEEGEEGEGSQRSPTDPQTYLRNIPNTPEMLEASNRRLALAYYNKAMVFKDRLNDYKLAASSLETLLDRFPSAENRLLALYYLVSLHREMNDHARANIFRDRLIMDFPDSEYAMILGDPDYAARVRAREAAARQRYQQTYSAFLSGMYEEVARQAAAADTLLMPVALKSQFAYLGALAAGQSGQRRSFRQQLERIVTDFPDQPVSPLASQLLASLDSPELAFLPEAVEEIMEESTEAALDGVFSYKPETAHFFMFVARAKEVDVRALRSAMESFHQQAFKDRSLSLSSIFLDEDHQLVTVTNFSDKTTAMEYFELAQTASLLENFRGESLESFVISVENYPVLYQQKNLEDYRAFFARRYLQD